MWPFDKLSAVLLKPNVAGLIAFLGYTCLIWFFHEKIATFLFGASPAVLTTPEAQYLFARGSIIVSALLVVLVGVALFIMVTEDTIARRARLLAEQLTRDISVSHEHLKTLYDNSPAPYFLMDDAGGIHNPNKAAMRFLGGTKEECEVMNLYQCLARDETGEGVSTLFKEKVERGSPITQEEVYVRNFKGEYQWALVSVHSLDRRTKISLRHLVTLIDMTKEKEAERVKSDFLLLASHQLRTLMTTIKWYADYLLHTPSIELASDVRQYVEEIDMGNQRMIELVNTLLTVSRLEMGTLSPEYSQVHVNEVVKDILQELTPDIKKRATQLTFDTSGDDVLTTDRTMVRISIHNLLTNAIKYTPQKGKVHISCVFTNIGCSITVVDGGCGIPLSDQEKIFTKMYRASNARKVSASGTGLGLHLTRSFIKKLGGTVGFSSEEGKGTTFTITLPRVAVEA